MGGFVNLVRRMSMAAFVLGIAFVLPNTALAQAPSLQPARLPLQTASTFKSATPFNNGWTRVVSETEQLIRTYADLKRYGAAPAIAPKAQNSASKVLTTPEVARPSAPSPEEPSASAGTVRATLKPIEVASKVVSESFSIQGVLVGVQFEVVD